MINGDSWMKIWFGNDSESVNNTFLKCFHTYNLHAGITPFFNYDNNRQLKRQFMTWPILIKYICMH